MEDKHEIVVHSLQHGVAAACAKYSVSKSTLAGWRRLYQQAEAAAVEATPTGATPMAVDASIFADKRGRNGRNLPQIVKDEVKASFDRARSRGIAVSRADLRMRC